MSFEISVSKKRCVRFRLLLSSYSLCTSTYFTVVKSKSQNIHAHKVFKIGIKIFQMRWSNSLLKRSETEDQRWLLLVVKDELIHIQTCARILHETVQFLFGENGKSNICLYYLLFIISMPYHTKVLICRMEPLKVVVVPVSVPLRWQWTENNNGLKCKKNSVYIYWNYCVQKDGCSTQQQKQPCTSFEVLRAGKETRCI